MSYRGDDLNLNMPDDEDLNGPGTGNIKSMILSQLVPEEYIFDPLNADPTLDNLRAAAQQYSEGQDSNIFNSNSGNGTSANVGNSNVHDKASNQESSTALNSLLNAAETDVNVHMARVKAVLAQDPSLLDTYSKYTDPEIQSRISRLQEMQQQRKSLEADSKSILNALNENMDLNSPTKQKKEGLTGKQKLDRRLAAWERALQMYIYANGDEKGTRSGSIPAAPGSNANLTMMQLLHHLCPTGADAKTSDDEEKLKAALELATPMCNLHLDRTSKLLQDAVEETADNFQSYHIHLIAHSVAAQYTLKKTSDVQAKFMHHGKEALKIGHELEMAEAKRRQSEHASVLLRRWWMMENLAEQEILTGEEIRVHEEIRGIIPSSSCRMDPLFTRPENSLEAAKTLKSLRLIVKCRSSTNANADKETSGKNGAKNGNAPKSEDHGSTKDPQAIKRFEFTNRLIQRTSAAVEQRLLNAFSELYSFGGVYDFSSTMAAKRPGRLNWLLLREIAEALMSFDSGRSLHKRYVGLVVSTKFPELFHHQDENARNGNSLSPEGKSADEDIDSTRSKLSNLFHRVCEVCTEEFQLIAHIFSPTLPQHLQDSSITSTGKKVAKTSSSFPETFPLQVARALLQRLISDPENGMQAQINGLLESIDQRGDFDSGAKKLDTFVVIHEKAAGLFHLLKEAAQKMWGTTTSMSSQDGEQGRTGDVRISSANAQSISALIQFLSTQEMSLSNGQRRGYLNLELRLLHHHCCANLDNNGGKLTRPVRAKEDSIRNSAGSGGLADYRAPIMPLDQESIRRGGFVALLNGPLKQSVLREPLIRATDSLARARLMFGSGSGGGEGVDSTARVVSTIYSQMCNFYGPSYLYPIIDSLGNMLVLNPPNQPPPLPFDESKESNAHNLGVEGNFWKTIERIHNAAKSFDRELWAENRAGSVRVWEILVQTRSQTSLTLGKERRIRFFQELEERGEAVILRALEAISNHIHWILVIGGEAATRSGTGNRRDGPYAVPSGSILESTNSPAVKGLTFCLRAQFIHATTALTPQSLAAYWTAVSRSLYDILVGRLLRQYKVSTVGAVVLSRDVEALRSASLLAGTEHHHWDTLRELLTLYMTPPDSLKTMLVGAEGDVNSGKGMFGRVGKEQSIVFMSRRVDYRYRTNQGSRKSQWATELLEELGVNDPTDGRVNITNYYAAENITSA